MKFITRGNKGIEIQYEDTDTDSEKRIVEQGMAFIRNLLVRIKELEK